MKRARTTAEAGSGAARRRRGPRRNRQAEIERVFRQIGLEDEATREAYRSIAPAPTPERIVHYRVTLSDSTLA